MKQRVFENDEERREFLRTIEQLLRDDNSEGALEATHTALKQVEEADDKLAALALSTNANDLSLKGWGELARSIKKNEERGNVITALGIDLSWPGHAGIEPDENGSMPPDLETNIYEDLEEIEFSTANRDDLLKGYSGSNSEWQGRFVDIDHFISIEGLERLYGAVDIAATTHRGANDAHGDMYSLAACASAILVHQTVRNTIIKHGLPKPMAVIVGSNEDYPFFDAPVMAIGESAQYVTRYVASPTAPKNSGLPSSAASSSGSKSFFSRLFRK